MLKWGIIGLGKIAHKFVKDLLLVPDNEVVAVASRSVGKANTFSSSLGLDCETFGDYHSLFLSSKVDIVYIATPHNSHAELSITAMRNGKHVLCEKPMAVNAESLSEMIRVAQKNNVFLMEALWSRFNPSIRQVYKLTQEGTIGSIKMIDVNFCHKLNGTPESRLFNMDLAGGSLLDMGIYPVFLSYLLLGKPTGIEAFTRFHKTGADIHTSVILKYDDAMATVSSSFDVDSDMVARIYGEEGKIYINRRWHESEGFILEKDGHKEEFQVAKLGKGYSHEIMECQTQIGNGYIESELWSHNDSLALISILDEIRKKINLKYPFENSEL